MSDKIRSEIAIKEAYECLKKSRDFGIRYLQCEESDHKKLLLHHVRFNLEEALAIIVSTKI